LWNVTLERVFLWRINSSPANSLHARRGAAGHDGLSAFGKLPAGAIAEWGAWTVVWAVCGNNPLRTVFRGKRKLISQK
jgi:hypothetical protein